MKTTVKIHVGSNVIGYFVDGFCCESVVMMMMMMMRKGFLSLAIFEYCCVPNSCWIPGCRIPVLVVGNIG